MFIYSNREMAPMTHWDYRLPNTMYKLFRKIPQSTVERIHRNIYTDSKKMGLLYLDKDGRERVIPLMLRPRVMSRKQANYLWKTTQIMNEAFSKVPELYFEHSEVREIFPFEPGEEKWIHDILPFIKKRHLRNLSRWDGNTDFSGNNWKGNFDYFENNAVGVGGVWYCPIDEEITLKEIYPELKKIDPKLKLEQYDDARLLLVKLFKRHAKALGMKSGHYALTIDRNCLENYVEFPLMAKYLKGHGLNALVADPRDLHLKHGDIYCRGKKISLVYRDTTLSEYYDMEEKGADLSALKLAFKQNRVISSLSGEFDHKSCGELFSSIKFSKHFTPKERAVFKKHMLWTRMVRDTKTDGLNGSTVDLIPYIRKNKNKLVLKPNRLFGGEGVEIGMHTSARDWEQQLEIGLKSPGYMVCQELAHIPVKRYPLLNPKTSKNDEEFYNVVGIISTEDGMAVVGRVAKRKVVNVAQAGGLASILVCKNL